MSNDNYENDLAKVIDGVCEFSSSEAENINSRCGEIQIRMKSLIEQYSLLLAESEKPTDVGDVDIHTQFGAFAFLSPD